MWLLSRDRRSRVAAAAAAAEGAGIYARFGPRASEATPSADVRNVRDIKVKEIQREQKSDSSIREANGSRNERTQ